MDTEYQKQCTAVVVSSATENSKTIWLPGVVLLHLDKKYFRVMNNEKWSDEQFGFTLDEHTESIEGFETFIKIWLNGSDIEGALTKDDVFALNSSARFKKQICNFERLCYIYSSEGKENMKLINEFGSDKLIQTMVKGIANTYTFGGLMLEQFWIRTTTDWKVKATPRACLCNWTELELLSRFKSIHPGIGLNSEIIKKFSVKFKVVKQKTCWSLWFEDGTTINFPLTCTHMKFENRAYIAK